MTLEQRVEALELAIANMALHQRETLELSYLVRDSVSEAIKNASLAGGAINAAHTQAAEFKIEHGSVKIAPASISASL